MGPIRGDQFPTQLLSEQNPKPRRTFQRTSNQKPERHNKDQREKTGSISCCLPQQTTRAQEGPIRGEQLSTQNLFEQTLSQEELSKKRQTRSPDNRQNTKTRKRAAFRAVLAHKFPNKTQTRRRPRTILLPQPFVSENEMQDPKGKKTMPDLSGKPNLSYNVAHNKQPNPQNRLELWRNGQSRFRGVRRPAGENKTQTATIIVPRQCAGSQTPRSPPRPLPRRIRPSTPSRRRVRTDAPRKRAGGAGGFAGR